MTAPVSFTRTTLTDNDTLDAAGFNAQSAVSATVRDATAGQSGVMPDTTTAAGLAMVIAASVAAQRTLLGLGTADSPTFAAITATAEISSGFVGGAAFRALAATTSSKWLQISNTGGDAIFGQERNTGGELITGSTAYDTVVRGSSGLAFSADGGSLHMRLSAAGLALAGALALSGGASFAPGTFYLNATDGLTLAGKAGSSSDFLIANSSGSVVLRNPTGGVALVTGGALTVAGQLTQYSATFAKTGTTLTDAAQSQVATLTNAPAGRSGNPTKWVPIDDNGVTRYMPAW